MVHLSVHDHHPADVQPDWDRDRERAGRLHSRALLEADSICNGLAARDREHDQHRCGSGAMASSAQMLLGLPTIFWNVLITGFVIALEVFVSHRTYSRILKYLALTLFSYVLVALVVRLEWGMVFHATLIPHIEFSADYLLNIVANPWARRSPHICSSGRRHRRSRRKS